MACIRLWPGGLCNRWGSRRLIIKGFKVVFKVVKLSLKAVKVYFKVFPVQWLAPILWPGGLCNQRGSHRLIIISTLRPTWHQVNPLQNFPKYIIFKTLTGLLFESSNHYQFQCNVEIGRHKNPRNQLRARSARKGSCQGAVSLLSSVMTQLWNNNPISISETGKNHIPEHFPLNF